LDALGVEERSYGGVYRNTTKFLHRNVGVVFQHLEDLGIFSSVVPMRKFSSPVFAYLLDTLGQAFLADGGILDLPEHARPVGRPVI